MDYASFSDRVVIRRVTIDSNPSLFRDFGIDASRLPLIYLVKNTFSKISKNYEKLIQEYKTDDYSKFNQMIKQYVFENQLTNNILQDNTSTNVISNQNDHIYMNR